MKKLFLALSLFLGVSMISCDSKSDIQTVKIACNLPLTGDVAVYGEVVKAGIELAMSDLKASGALDSLNLEFDIQDNRSNNSETVGILRKQLFNKPNVYISGLDHQSKVIIEQITKEGLTHFTYSWEPFICEYGKNNFRTTINLEQESDYYVEFAQKRNSKRITIVHVNEPGAYTLFDDLVIPKLKQCGISEIKKEVYDIETVDYKSIASKIKQYDPDAIMLTGYDRHLVAMIKDFRNYKLIKNNNTMCGIDVLDAANLLSPNMLEDIRFACPQFVLDSNGNEEWKTRFEKMHNRKPRYGDAYAYDMTYIIHDAFKRAEKDYSYDNINNLIKNTKIKGVTGALSFDESRNLSLNLNICQFKNGQIIKDL